MSGEKEDGGPALPFDGGPAFPWGEHGDQLGGMSLRDYFAAQALAGYASNMPASATYGELAQKCYRAADAMLAERIVVQP